MPVDASDLAELISEGDFVAEDLQELRLALVMTGGVSLAVWMGGSAHELNRLTRAENPTYLELLRMTRSLPRIDVIAGTSAGGLNGALLGYAITQNAPVSELRGLWLQLGALERLLRQPTVANPPSLMRGDEYFLPEIRKAIGQLRRTPTDPRATPMELIITTTMLSAWPRGVPDSFGTVIQDADHRGEFAFRRGESTDDDFGKDDIEARLALAARCTASFPFAFEAAFVPVGAPSEEPPLPDMADHANFGKSRFVIDGGVLLNQPLRPALRAIFRQSASRQVRRVLAYVVPDPGEALKVTPDEQADVPTLGDIGVATMIRLPRNQSVSAELDELTLHNTRVDAQRRRRELVVVDLDVDDLARRAYDQYRSFRADVIAGWLFRLLARGFTVLEVLDLELQQSDRFVGEAPLRERARLREQLIDHLESLPPEQFPTAAETAQRWFTTVDTAERAAAVVLDLLRRGLAVLDPNERDSADVRRELRDLRQLVCSELAQAQATREPLSKEQELELAREAVQALRENRLRRWADDALPRVLGDPDRLEPIVARIADQLMPAADAVIRACEQRPKYLGIRARKTKRYATELVNGLSTHPGAAPTPLHRVLALEVVQLTLGGQPIVEQRVDLIQVSANAGNGLDPRERAEEKLAGLQIAHFGAFYKRSWRANDWMWGRHDAVQRLAQILLEPVRLRQLGFSVDSALESIERIAFGGLTAEEEQVLRAATPRPWDREKARAELSFLQTRDEDDRDDDETDDKEVIPPAALPMCAQAVARRLQLGVLREELPELRRAIEWDRNDGAHMSTEAQQFCDEYDTAPKPLSAADAVRLFHDCRVGQERIADETGSDLLARTATRTLAVTTAATGGDHSGLPKLLRRPLHILRGLGLMVYLVVRHALEGSRAGAMLVTGALFAGAALVGVGLVVDIPGFLMIAGLGAVLAAVALSLYRRKPLLALAAFVGGLVFTLLPRICSGWIFDFVSDDNRDRVEPLFVVGGLLVGALILAGASVEWPEGRQKESAGASRDT